MNAHIIQPNVVDLSKATQPKPVDGEQIVVRTFRLDHKADLPPSMPILAGKTTLNDDFAMTINPQGAEVYLLVDQRDHRIVHMGDMLDAWLKAMGGKPTDDRPRLLTQLDGALVACETAIRLADTDIEDAVANANAAVNTIESALRLVRSFRANLEARLNERPALATADTDEV